MRLNLIDGGRNVASRDITAFYGVNRTAKINDFELSDAMNFDSEAFPHIETRKARKLFYDENKMQLICNDTDVYDDYKVTGVTEDGGFVYRGEKLLDSGLSGNTQITEFSGDYVLLPGKKVVTVNQSVHGEDVLYNAKTQDISTDLSGLDLKRLVTDYGYTTHSTLGSFKVSANEISCLYGFNYGLTPYCNTFKNFFFEVVCPGMYFNMDLVYGTELEVDDKIVTKMTECDIPEDVCMVVDEVYFTVKGDDLYLRYSYGDSDFNKVFFEKYLTTSYEATMHIKFTARKNSSGEIYDISEHFKNYWSVGGSVSLIENIIFRPGLVAYSSGIVYFNGFGIEWCAPSLVVGAVYGGRFFGCDNLGVTVYYSSASDKYDFAISESAGGAGYVLCSDPGKWTAICPYNEVLYVFKRNGMYRIYSSDGLSFYMERIADVGAVSNDAVCVVDNVMYFLSENGLCRFLGSYPEYLPDSLGKKYSDGVLGGSDGKIFASLTYKDGDVEKSELCVWHTDKQIFSVHDDFSAEKFVSAAGELFALSDGSVYKMECEREPLEFSLDTKNYFFSFTKKGVNGARLYFDFSGNEGEYFEVFVSYDGGEFEPCFKPITNGKVKYVPIRLRKCDEVKLKISGKGVFTLKGLSFSLYQNGDVRQNR